MNHSDWVEQISDGDAINAIATKAGIVHRTFARQVERSRISAENVIAIAIAYGHHPSPRDGGDPTAGPGPETAVCAGFPQEQGPVEETVVS